MSADHTSEPSERVLSTLNEDGSRRWLFPRVSPGRFLRWRQLVAYALIVVYNALPWIEINGKPSILLDLPSRQFTFFGATFLPTDTLLLMLFVAGVFVTVFLLTALLGRVWCGWACPQTVYMEFVYRPIERLFDGNPDKRRRGGPGPGGVRTCLKYAFFFVVSLHLAHTFLAYFVGADNLFQWTKRSPFEHPTSFLIVAATTALMMFDFCFFREQMCIVACPYGRFQSVLLDRSSVIIKYDDTRGEPRGRLRRAGSGDVSLPQLGDCIDCNLCVITCPTGIDIREGLQMECVGCAQCIDACDSVMTRIKRATGLIRYSSEQAMEHGRRRIIRPRVILYPAMLAVIVIAFTTVLMTRQPADITLLRGSAQPYRTLDSGEIDNVIRVKIVNRLEAEHRFTVTVTGLSGAHVIPADEPIVVAGGATAAAIRSIVVPKDSFELGRASITVRVTSDDGYVVERRHRLQGPWGSAGSAGNAQESGP